MKQHNWCPPGGEVRVDVPAGSVEGDHTLSYERLSADRMPQPLPEGFVAQALFDLSVSRVQSPITGPFSFKNAILITIRLTEADAVLAGDVESNVVIQHLGSNDDTWKSLATTVDSTFSTARASVDSLSIFALTVKLAEPPTPTPTDTATPTATAIAPTKTPAAKVLTPTATEGAGWLAHWDSDGDANPQAAGTDCDTNTNPKGDSDRNATTDCDTNSDPHHAHTRTNGYAYAYPCHADANAHCETNPDCHAHSNTNANSDCSTYANPDPNPGAPPNLVAFKPEGWDSPLVVSESNADFVDVPPPTGGPFSSSNYVYLHWAIKNDSSSPVNEEFEVEILFDGKVEYTFRIPGLGAGEIKRKLNVRHWVAAAGPHSLAIAVALASGIDESNDADNIFSANHIWRHRPPNHHLHRHLLHHLGQRQRRRRRRPPLPPPHRRRSRTRRGAQGRVCRRGAMGSQRRRVMGKSMR